jgi:hypothetical protein
MLFEGKYPICSSGVILKNAKSIDNNPKNINQKQYIAILLQIMNYVVYLCHIHRITQNDYRI